MKKKLIIFIAFGIFSCKPNPETKVSNKTGDFRGIIEYGNFSDKILFEIESDSINFKAFFTSLEQNANRIPFQNVEVSDDSINFKLQSDFYTYSFKNKWIENNNKLQGSLTVDTIKTYYVLEKELIDDSKTPKSEEISFESNGFTLNGTIFHSSNKDKALIILTSSGNADRSASRAEALLFAQMGFTTFHYDKRGTGNSEGNWEVATIEELSADDINAIKYFSDKTGIPFKNIGIKGSSQGATKIPFILSKIENLEFGVAVSCPGVTLLESDLNYWTNRNTKVLGDEIEDATALQRKVFKFIAGELSRVDLEKAIDNEKSKSWFANIWIPSLDEVQTDKKLLYSPIPYFETTKQPVLILQGKLDEIIPSNSHELIANALTKSGNKNFKIVLLDGASHSIYYVGESDFPYWSKIHPNYLKTIQDWINDLSNKK
ncbi:prolyl oligopeptidase family serine peptidase [Flaviramulus sp. BrNp1-15]|uniref:alpha/beta hydrolase family protein n=1 Tax=Flaviramulus sp. BrNp1-15 TaxID=2916754 RepID=UPI001EE91623|nr:prolyl oligopeptidase family serine peptidase [Flaviramulus sp. BrNp1-15]ULC60441.1 prolyl oligopeptidase family serine peptidase [Flaviramulus sp. BrNp1-15]